MNYEVNKKNITFNRLTILTIVIFIPFLKPDYFNTLWYMNTIYKCLKIFSYATLLTYFLKRKKICVSKIMLLISIFYLELIIVTVIKTDNITKVINYCIPTLLLCLFFDSIKGIRIKYVLKGLIIIHLALAYINLISVLAFPNGLYAGRSNVENYYFLGHNNSAIRILLPGIIFSGVYDYLEFNKLKLRTKMLTIATMLTVTLTWSNTAMIGCGIILFYILFVDKIKLKKTINATFLILIPVVSFFSIVLLRKQELFSYLIIQIFKKDLTLSNRTVIWDAIWTKILESPIWGYGYGNNIWEVISIGNLKPSSAHNYFLDLIFQGGVVQLLILISILWIISKRICNKKVDIYHFIIWGFLAYFIMWQIEPFVNTGIIGMFLFFILSYKVSNEIID